MKNLISMGERKNPETKNALENFGHKTAFCDEHKISHSVGELNEIKCLWNEQHSVELK